MTMHRLLHRQLERLGLGADESPQNAEAWQALLERISAVYEQADTESRRMTRSLEISSAEMRELHGRVERQNRDLEEIVALRTVELLRARDEAKNALRVRSEFLANMSHEIRTPMTAILGFAELMSDESFPDRAGAIQTIRSNAEHLLAVINDILDLSKLESGKFTLESVTCSPGMLVEQVTALMDVKAQAKGIELRTTVAEDVPTHVTSDPTRVRQVLLNLVGNAIKFTPEGSVTIHVSVAGVADDGTVGLQFAVRDTGIGMSEDQLARAFEAFEQADTSTTREFGGTGLGLALCKRIVERMAGHIRATSSRGAGTTVSLTIPVAITEPSRVERAREERREAAPRPTALQGARILLAEDGLDNQRLVSHILRRVGAIVETVVNGREAVERMKDNRFDLVLMDMLMPIMDGYAAMTEARHRGYTGAIVALTANAMSHDRGKCLDAGADDYLAKPIRANDLIETCTRWVAAGGARQGAMTG